jgi:hypothetical protein
MNHDRTYTKITLIGKKLLTAKMVGRHIPLLASIKVKVLP